MIESRFEAIRQEIVSEHDQSGKTYEEFEKELKKAISDMKEGIQSLNEDRKLSLKQIMSDFNEEANMICQKLGEDENHVQITRERMEDIIEEMSHKTREDILNEKKEREANEDLLLSMMENTCEKIQSLVG